MHPRRPRTRGGRIPRWGANPPPPSPPPSPPLSPPPPPSPPAGEHDGGNDLDLRHLLSQFTRTVSIALQGRRNTEGSDIKRVKELGANEFHGSADPAEADAWLTDVERIFEVLQCPDRDRVRLAAFLLKGNAYHWRKAVRRGYANPAVLTWEEFQRVFFDQFYPHSYKNEKKSEFLHLRQGSMSVLEYEHKFNELSRFAPELVTTEEDRCTRFEEGLWLDIQAVVTANTYPTMRALAQAADRVARKYSLGAGIGRRRRDSSGFGEPSQGPSKRGGSSSNSAGSEWSGGRGSSSGSGRSGSRPAWSQHSGQQSVASTAKDFSQQYNATCHGCGQTGHLRRDCPQRGQTSGPSRRSGVSCYHCGQTGHYRSECPLLTVGGTAEKETWAQQGQGNRGQGQAESGASSSAAGSSSSSGVQSTFRGRSGRSQRGPSGRSTTHARVFSMTQQEAQATPDLITVLEVDLIQLNLVDLDIILGMDWLEEHRVSISDGENFAVRPPFEAPFLAKASSLPPLPSPPLFSNRKPGKRRWRRRENQLKLSTSPATFPAISSCAVTWNR
ncbi:hypothetical protein L3X38_013060 [Prunus dulcis]|uniref:CCHC-type domain-containing protein n=1 Tax=Prunus dulcis TaxID=3755 RepID=A0AAD4WKI8_PRUDU|nr:hypothetical protein L3X38_013060 [Prunus dulcis]